MIRRRGIRGGDRGFFVRHVLTLDQGRSHDYCAVLRGLLRAGVAELADAQLEGLVS